MIRTIGNRLISKLGLYFRFPVMARCFDTSKKFNYLDIGCGNHSPTITKNHFPNAMYYGVDIIDDYNNTEEDLEKIDGFYKMNLSGLEFDEIPDNFFDIINMSHIIEHLLNGDDVIRGLVPKLKENGIMYIEFPNMKSTELPSMEGTLNFFDDPDHKRIYSLKELYNLLLSENMAFVEGGRRRNIKAIVVTPFNLLFKMYKHGHGEGGALWDLMGFADYCVFKKKAIDT